MEYEKLAQICARYVDKGASYQTIIELFENVIKVTYQAEKSHWKREPNIIPNPEYHGARKGGYSWDWDYPEPEYIDIGKDRKIIDQKSEVVISCDFRKLEELVQAFKKDQKRQPKDEERPSGPTLRSFDPFSITVIAGAVLAGLKAFALANPWTAGIVVLAIGVGAVLAAWRFFYPISWYYNVYYPQEKLFDILAEKYRKDPGPLIDTRLNSRSSNIRDIAQGVLESISKIGQVEKKRVVEAVRKKIVKGFYYYSPERWYFNVPRKAKVPLKMAEKLAGFIEEIDDIALVEDILAKYPPELAEEDYFVTAEGKIDIYGYDFADLEKLVNDNEEIKKAFLENKSQRKDQTNKTSCRLTLRSFDPFSIGIGAASTGALLAWIKVFLLAHPWYAAAITAVMLYFAVWRIFF